LVHVRKFVNSSRAWARNCYFFITWQLHNLKSSSRKGAERRYKFGMNLNREGCIRSTQHQILEIGKNLTVCLKTEGKQKHLFQGGP
jgi:hypothetical protein